MSHDLLVQMAYSALVFACVVSAHGLKNEVFFGPLESSCTAPSLMKVLKYSKTP